ncbi:MAG: YkgJ family cysteine cluster protein [Acidiferrobacteraceae bacterium]
MNRRLPIATITTDTKCGYCVGSKCCSYITQKVDAPRSRGDFDHLLWQVSHRGVSVYKDTDGWYLLFETRCDHLLSDGRCGIYDTRPQICRDYSNDYCEFDEPAERHFKLLFSDYESLLRYREQRFRRRHPRAESPRTKRPRRTRHSL